MFSSAFDPLVRDFIQESWEPSYVMPRITSGADRPGMQSQQFCCHDCVELPDRFEYHIEMPGCTKEKIDLSISDNILTVKCDRDSCKETEGCTFLRKERSRGTLLRTFRLPHLADQTVPQCKYENGVLCVSFPKRSGGDVRKLNIA
jgi:HSP20 family protein